MRVPALALDSGDVLIQSLAIIEYLDETHPQPPLLAARSGRARQGARARAADRLRHPPAQQCRPAALPQERARPGPGQDRRLVSSLDPRRLRRARGDDRGRALRLRRRGHARRHLPGAAGLQCAAPQGAARSLSRRSSRSTPPAPSLPPSTRRGRKTSRTRSDAMPRLARSPRRRASAPSPNPQRTVASWLPGTLFASSSG